MVRSWSLVVFTLALVLAAGCTSRPEPVEIQHPTSMASAGDIVKADAVGKSWGVSLFGFIPLGMPTQSSAISDLYQDARHVTRRPVALVNIVGERTWAFFLLFTYEEIRIRADMVEVAPAPFAER